MNLRVIRGAAIGDVLCAEPIIRKLSAMGHRIHVSTMYPDTFTFNSVISSINKDVTTDNVINLDLSYERLPLVHIVDAYVTAVQKVLPEFVLGKNERIPVYNENFVWKNSNSNIVAVNSEGSWASRTYDVTRWRQFVTFLKENGNHIIEIGSNPDKYLGIGENYYGKLKLSETIELMQEADVYVGMDGGLMHFAQSIGLPMFVIFGCTCPVYRIHDWHIAKVLWKNSRELNCAGCHHRRLGPRRETECFRESTLCLDFSVQHVIDTYMTVPYGNKPELTDVDGEKMYRLDDFANTVMRLAGYYYRLMKN